MSDLRQMTDDLSALAKGFINSEVIFAANEAGVFSELEEDRSADDIAAALGWPERSARMLLDALVSLELVAKRGGRYRNAPIASACLVPGGAAYQGHILRHYRHMSRGWAQLPEVLRTGKPAKRDEAERSPDELRAFILGMRDIAKLSAREVLKALDLSAYRHMLDLGGGPATYAIAFLDAHPAMKATVFDSPPVIDIAREEVARARLEDRIDYIAGDLTVDDYGKDYDFVFVSNIIHSMGPEKNRAMVRKCHEALASGGLLVIKDFLTDNDRSGPAFSLMFALHMYVGTGEGDTYAFAEVEEWTREVGFSEGRVVDLTPQSRMWLVNKP